MSNGNDFGWEFEEQKSEFDSIPNGDYRLKIRSAEKAVSNNKENPKKMIKLKLGVSGYSKSIYHYIVFLPDNREVTNRNLTNFFRSFDIPLGNFDLQSYVGKIGAGRIETDQQGYERVRFFLEGTMKNRLPEFKEPSGKEAPKSEVHKKMEEEDDIPF